MQHHSNPEHTHDSALANVISIDLTWVDNMHPPYKTDIQNTDVSQPKLFLLDID